MGRSVAWNLLAVLAVAMVVGEKEKDRAECGKQLVGLATCLPYVGGQAPAPTPDCCGGLKQVLKNNSKCLCVIIRDKDAPDLGLHINVTLALTLPSVCHNPADVAKCPALLHMDPKSPEAQVFYQLAHPSTTHVSPAPARTDGSSMETENSRAGSARANGESYLSRRKGLEFQLRVPFLCLWYLASSKLRV